MVAAAVAEIAIDRVEGRRQPGLAKASPSFHPGNADVPFGTPGCRRRRIAAVQAWKIARILATVNPHPVACAPD
jgi:hypothetical protein